MQARGANRLRHPADSVMNTTLDTNCILTGFFWIACGGWFTWFTVAAAVIGAGTSIYEGSKNRAALSKAGDVANGLTYQPIDINALLKQAHDQAVTNATQSLALERSLQPGVADTRTTLPGVINKQLALGGSLSPDTANAVATAGRVIGGNSGIGGSSAPLTAALIGQSSEQLRQSRINNASGLLAANPLPTAGLDPGALASLVVSQNNAQNQFNAAKAGIQTNLINSQAQAGNAAASQTSGAFTNLLGTLGKAYGTTGSNTGTTYDPNAYSGAFNPAFGAFRTPDGLLGQSATVGATTPGG